MNIFIIGPSRSAKTPISDQVAAALGYKRISASDWVRNIFVPSGPVVLEDNGQFAFVPSHKLSLGELEFKSYLKLKRE